MIARGSSFSGNERHCVFLNTGTDRFADVSSATTLDFLDDGRAVALTDWDGDGDIDFWLANRTSPRLRLIRNDLPNKNAHVALLLRGVSCNRDAIGARVEIDLASKRGQRRLIETVRAGSGFLTQSSRWLHFGVSPHELVTRVRVRWPGSKSWEEIVDVIPGARYEVIEGTGTARKVAHRSSDSALKPVTLELPAAESKTRVVLSRPVPVAPLDFENFSGERVPVLSSESGSSATLVNLWASWCTPCLQELRSFTDGATRLRDAGIHVVAMATDSLTPVTENDETTADAQELVRRLKFPFPVGLAVPETVQTLSRIKSRVLYRERPIPLPSSYLLDAKGRLAVLYTGPVEVEQLLRDVALLEASQAELDAEAFPGTGRFVFRDSQVSPLAVAEAFREAGYLEEAWRELQDLRDQLNSTSDSAEVAKRLQTKVTVTTRLAEIAIEREAWSDAVGLWREALVMAPKSVQSRVGLATAYAKQGNMQAAKLELDHVVSLAADDPNTHLNVGMIWRRLDQEKLAIHHFRQGLELTPQSRVLIFALASTLQSSGSHAEAITRYRNLVEHGKDQWSMRAANNLAWLMSTHPDARFRRGAVAVELARRACAQSNHQNPTHLGTLGAAHAEAGQFEEAIAATKQALLLAEGDSELLASLKHRLALYENGHPYREAAD